MLTMMVLMMMIIIIISMRRAFAAEYFPIYVSWHQQVCEAQTLFGAQYCQDGVMSCPALFLSCRSLECKLKQYRRLTFYSTPLYSPKYPCGQSRAANIQAKR